MQENKEIPSSWKIVKLGEIASYINGKAFKPTEWSKEGLPIIRIQNLNREQSEFNYCSFPVDDKYYVNKGDLLFAWSGTPDTSFGAHIWSGGRAVLNQHIFRIIIDENKITKRYYLYALNHKVKEFVSKAHGTAGLAHITKRKFEESAIALPPLPEQHRIVAKIEELFSELDKGVEALKTAQQQLKVYRQAVLKWAFEGKLTEEWRRQQKNLPIASKLLEQIKAEREKQAKTTGKKPKSATPLTEAELVELPSLTEGWCWAKLAEICEDISDGDHQPPPKAADGVPFVTISNITNNRIDFNKTFHVPEQYYGNLGLNRKPQKGDILYTVTGSFGIPVMIDYKKQFCFQRHIGLVRPSNKINQAWLYYLLQAPIIFDQARKVATGTAQKTVSLEGLRNFKVPVISAEEQDQIVQEIESRLSVADKIEESIVQSLKQAEALRQNILKKAFSGKLVPQDPNDEPAEKLLARIKKEKATKTQGNSTVKRRGAGRKTASSQSASRIRDSRFRGNDG